MKIWIHSPFDNLPQEGFRKQRYWLMAEAFAAAGHDVVYWTADFNHGTKAPRCLAGGFVSPPRIALRLGPTSGYERNVSLRRIWSHVLYARRLASAGAALVATDAVHRPDVVISATPTLGAARSAFRLARRYGATFVLDMQDAWPETFYRLLPRVCRPLGALLLAPMHACARRLYREADLVSGVSRRYGEIARRADFMLAYHGLACPDEPVEASAGNGVPTRLAYAGNLGEGYDLETVLEAVVRDGRLTLDIAGKGPREPSLRAQVTRLGLSERVRFHGYLAAADLRALLDRCDVGIVPMRDDSWVGLPYKLGDYLAAGLKVVSSLHGECAELLERARLGSVYDFGSADSLLRALASLPGGAVRLPDELRAERIYPRYVELVERLVKENRK